MNIGTKQLPDLLCDHCKSVVSDVSATCFTCGQLIGFPNVRSAGKAEEKRALEARYSKAFEEATDGHLDRLKDFSKKLKTTCAVFNEDIGFLHTFITNNKALYASYILGVKGKLRKPAKGENDRHRTTVESMIFGAYGEDIRYAALSLDGIGVKSYGKYSLRLRDVAIDTRASLLEDNSYVFVEKHGMKAGTEIPPGHRATWEDREKLALAKLAQKITSSTSEAEYAKILLFSEGDYKTDQFIEVHIYGEFDANAIDSVAGNSTNGDKVEAAMLEVVKDHLKIAGKQWIEA